jgi:hypothetical protein
MTTNVIVVKDVVKGTSTNAEAVPLYFCIDNILSQNNAVILSLKDCPPLSSSFLNSSIGNIIEKYGFSSLKGKLSISDYTPTIAGIVTSYIENCKKLSVNS